MRSILLALTFLSFATAGYGQVIISLLLGDKLNTGKIEFGLDGGVNYSWQTGVAYGRALPTFNLGFYFDIKTKNPNWLFHTGVIVKSTMGANGLPVYSLNNPDLDNTFVGGSIERTLSYFNVPVFAKRKLGNSFYVEGGIMLGLLYHAEDLFTASVQGGDATYARSIRDQYRALDAGLGAGVGYRLMKGNGMNLGIRGYQGLVNVLEYNPGTAVRNQSLYFTIGIPIGAGKARQRETEAAKP
ncbi:MAG: PorT family protein [Cyclobacteriaceae bacterium]|nr:PorT family protein [Cyclobacteriaceae bacterium]